MIRFDHFSYSYGKDLVLKDINAELPTGTLTVVTGLSGCGKSTFCRSLCGLVPHFFGGRAAGGIYLGELPILTSKLAAISAQVAIVLEDYESQLLSLTVREEMAFSLSVPLAQQDALIESQLAAVGLTGYSGREIASLSGGQKQRLAIAAALSRRPKFIIFDEPAAALDPAGKLHLYTLLKELAASGMTVVAAEQDPRDLMLFADQLLVLEEGRIRFSGSPTAVAGDLEAEPLYQQFLPDLWRLRGLIGTRDCPYWKTEEEALRYLAQYLKSGEVEQSA